MQVLIDCLKEKLENEGDKYVIDKQRLAEGLYIKADKNFNVVDFLHIKEKKDAEITELYYFFLERYFYSKIIYNDSNKCIDAKEKKFHSVNPLSLIFKRNNCPDKIEKLAKSTIADLNKKGINTKKLNKDEMFDMSISAHFQAMEIFFDDNNTNDIDYMYQKENFRLLVYKVMDLCEKIEVDSKEDFPICIFIDEDLEPYKNYSLKYLKDKIFVNNEYNLKIDEKLFGANAFSNTLNTKKPFLQMINTSFKIPYLTTFEDALLYYKLSFVINDISKELDDLKLTYNPKDKTIEYLEYINIQQKRKDCFDIKALQVKDYKDIDIEPIVIQLNKEEIKKKLNYFSKNIFYSFLYDDLKTFSKKASNVYSNNKVLVPLISNKDAIRGYFNSNYNISIEKPIHKFIEKVLEYEIEKHEPANDSKYFNFHELQAKWDLGISIMSCFSERRIYSDMQSILKEIRTNITDEFLVEKGTVEIKDDKTYYFLVGQVCQYLVSRSKTANKTGFLISPFLNVKDDDNLKKLIIETYKKYAHAMPLYSEARINRAIQSILATKPTKDLKDSDMRIFLTAGLIGPNMFYEKIDKNNDNMEENKND